jgi:acyl carrier protein
VSRFSEEGKNPNEQAENRELLITSRMLNEAMSRVYISDEARDINYDFGTRLADTGMDSLQLAELIIELEDALGMQFELMEIDRLETLGDFCRALKPMGELS